MNKDQAEQLLDLYQLLSTSRFNRCHDYEDFELGYSQMQNLYKDVEPVEPVQKMQDYLANHNWKRCKGWKTLGNQYNVWHVNHQEAIAEAKDVLNSPDNGPNTDEEDDGQVA